MVLSKRLLKWSATPLLLLLIVASQGQAKVTGKISGVVTDAETGNPLIGATVSVQATSLATLTDEDGEYFIINVPVGDYDLTVTHVGFEKLTKKEVRVLVDLTTPVDFVMTQMAVELPDEVVVYAQAPLIQKDLTASRIIFTEDRLRNLPNITTVQAVLTNYPGVVVDADNNMHIRGGRNGQVAYYYDGFSIDDPFTASAGIRVMPSALEELSLTSGGFTAEYGEALSGVVSAVTPEGGSAYRGKLRLYQGMTHEYDVSTGEWGPLKSLPNRSVGLNFSGPIPGADPRRYTFFSSLEYLRNNSFLPHNWQTSYTGTAKFAAQPTARLKLKSNLTYGEGDGAVYTHRDVNNVSYDFNLDGLPVFDRKSYLLGFSGSYASSERAVLSLSVNQFYTKTYQYPEQFKDLYWDQWPGYSVDAEGNYNGTIDDDNYNRGFDQSDPMQASGFTAGDNFYPTYALRETRYNSLAGNLVAQADKTNQVKSGFELRRYDVRWDFKQFFNSYPYGEAYSCNPLEASFYLEDKIEQREFVINLGLRFDYRDPDIAYNITPENETATYKQADSKSFWSPRLGVSFPISDRSKMHFNYGLYYQMPRYRYLYTNLAGDRNSGLPILGNPDLKPEKTTSYELGLDHLIGESIRLDVTGYYKDIDDLVSAREYGGVGATETVTKYVNADYGHVTGFDVALEKLPKDSYLSGSISYGYMTTKGNGSDADDPYYGYLTSATDTLAPLTEYALDFDQRHTVTAVLDYRVPAEWSYNLFGMKMPGAWGLSMVGYYGSGLPYTRTDANGNRLGDRNANRLPATYSVDMRFNKDFTVGRLNNMLTWFVEVDNVFNRHNVLNVYTRTGKPDDDGNVRGADLALDYEELSSYNKLMDHDPQNYSPPRTIRTGLEFTF